jgi:hypothetical protein
MIITHRYVRQLQKYAGKNHFGAVLLMSFLPQTVMIRSHETERRADHTDCPDTG